MVPCAFFLNELSYRYDGDRTPEELVPRLLSTLEAIRATKKIRRDLVIAGNVPISKIAIGDGTHSIASLLCGSALKEEWRLIKSVDQSSPGDASWKFAQPHDRHDVTFEGQKTFGMLWANANKSLTLSLALNPTWEVSQLSARLEVMEEDGEILCTEIRIPNASSSDHVEEHTDLIFGLGKHEASSSVIYSGPDFIIRIYFFDHDPPHFHVCSSAQPAETLASVTIETLDILEGRLPRGINRLVRQWAEARLRELTDNWERCSKGLHPFLIDG